MIFDIEISEEETRHNTGVTYLLLLFTGAFIDEVSKVKVWNKTTLTLKDETFHIEKTKKIIPFDEILNFESKYLDERYYYAIRTFRDEYIIFRTITNEKLEYIEETYEKYKNKDLKPVEKPLEEKPVKKIIKNTKPDYNNLIHSGSINDFLDNAWMKQLKYDSSVMNSMYNINIKKINKELLDEDKE